MYSTVDEIMLKFAANFKDMPWADPKDVVEVDKQWEDPHWFDMERDQTIPDLRVPEFDEKTDPDIRVDESDKTDPDVKAPEEAKPHDSSRSNLIMGKYGKMSLEELVNQYDNPEEKELIASAAAGLRDLITYLVDDRKRYAHNPLYDKLTSWVLDKVVEEEPLRFLKVPYKRDSVVVSFRPWSELALEKLKNEDPLALIGSEVVMKRSFVWPHYKDIWEKALQAEEGSESGKMFVDTDDFTSFQALGRRTWFTDPDFFLSRVYPTLEQMIKLRFRETNNMQIRKKLRIQKGALLKAKRQAELKLMEKRTHINYSGLVRLAKLAGDLDKRGEHDIADMIDSVIKLAAEHGESSVQRLRDLKERLDSVTDYRDADDIVEELGELSEDLRSRFQQYEPEVQKSHPKYKLYLVTKEMTNKAQITRDELLGEEANRTLEPGEDPEYPPDPSETYPVYELGMNEPKDYVEEDDEDDAQGPEAFKDAPWREAIEMENTRDESSFDRSLWDPPKGEDMGEVGGPLPLGELTKGKSYEQLKEMRDSISDAMQSKHQDMDPRTTGPWAMSRMEESKMENK